MNQQEMRVGVCYCNPGLAKIFTGQELIINDMHFVLKGILTTRASRYRKELTQNRCAFFVDHHIDRSCSPPIHLVELSFLEIVSYGAGRGWKLFIYGVNRNRPLEHSWADPVMPAVEEMVAMMENLIGQLPPRRLANFFERIREGQDGQTTG